MRFSEITGHNSIKTRLIQAVKDQRISHAQLFSGQEGSGNLAMALAYGQYVMCINKGSEDSCGSCSSCTKYQKLVHPDLHFVFPVSTTKEIDKHPLSDKFLIHWRESILKNSYLTLNRWLSLLDIENKQVSINAEECVEVVKKLSLKTYESDYKIMIIWLPEKLYYAAAPKLLKIIEEPPSKTIFLLVTENQEQLLTTILSRLQITKIPKLTDDEVREALQARYDVSSERASHIALLANGNFAYALDLLNETSADFSHEDFLKWMRLCYSVHKEQSMIALINWVDDFSGLGRERQKNFIALGLTTVRECLMMTYHSDSIVRLGQEEKVPLSKFSPFVNGANVMELYNELNSAYIEIERNINPKILMLDVSLKMAKLLRLKTEVINS